MNFEECLPGFAFEVACVYSLVYTLAEGDDQDYKVYDDIEADHVKKVKAKLVAYGRVFDVESEEKQHLNCKKNDKLVENVDEVVEHISHRTYADVVAQQ